MLIATEGGGLKSRAFTLIELLAVIIIIGVIALVATPVIIGVINKTERVAFERSIDGLLETVRLDYSTNSFVSPREYYYEGKDLILLTVAEETKDESIGMKGKIDGKDLSISMRKELSISKISVVKNIVQVEKKTR